MVGAPGFLIGSAAVRRISRRFGLARRISLLDPSAVMASTYFLLGSLALLIERLPCWVRRDGFLLFRRPRGSLFGGPEGHAVFPHRRA